MADRENVIKALELCTSKIETRTQVPCEACSYHNTKYHGVLGDGCCNIRSLHRDCLALLKAQEPRLLTWDELIATDHFYIETNKDGQKYIVPGIVTIVCDTAVIASVRIGTRLIDGTIDKDVYGIECRCWTSRPTDELREATPWQ